ncbi:MAG: hypothetical protein M5U28_28055 [Sandaracinaceae bacterium]|nr:hypothetical protein [Sandaracinaceae bacterium]
MGDYLFDSKANLRVASKLATVHGWALVAWCSTASWWGPDAWSALVR